MIRVMLVDDSAVIRGLLTRALTADPAIEIVASAANGSMALQMLTTTTPDIIILDIEMPVMDGMTALPKLLAAAPNAKVIMASTLTERNASISLQALELGASDYLAKPTARDTDKLDLFYQELIAKVKALAGSHYRAAAKPKPMVAAAPQPSAPKPVVEISPSSFVLPQQPVKALAIASSTGGPQALQVVFAALKGQLLHLPIFITQHMPPTFTTLLAEHITKAGGRPCAEGKEGEAVQAGHAYLAPGDYHMIAQKNAQNITVHLNQEPPENFCRPSADPMLRSLSTIYGASLLTVVLTGMGQDGLEGAKIVTKNGGTVIAQDEATCVVWGMPRAVTEAKLCKAVLPLDQIGQYLIRAGGNARS